MNSVKVFTDGASRGNPGAAGIGILICDKNNNTLREHHEYIGKTTNNQAEYSAIIKSLDLLKELITDYNFDSIEFYSDSELMVKQIRGEYKIKNNGLKPLIIEFHSKIKQLSVKFSINHIKRELNKIADNLANKALDEALKNLDSV